MTTDGASCSSICAPASADSGASASAADPAVPVPRSKVAETRHAASFPRIHVPISAADTARASGPDAAVAPRLVFDVAVLEAPVADRDPVRNADQLEVCKHHARPLTAIVEKHLDPGRLELVVELVGEGS